MESKRQNTYFILKPAIVFQRESGSDIWRGYPHFPAIASFPRRQGLADEIVIIEKETMREESKMALIVIGNSLAKIS